MRKFDTKIQHWKYKVLRAVARHTWHGDLMETLIDIPKQIIPGNKPTARCCVYKERAIIGERVKVAMGGDKTNPNVIEVITEACDECPIGGYHVTETCRGCVAHRCEDVCKFGAIVFDAHQKAHIDKSKCKECGACSKACPYSAIANLKRPCQKACKPKAITMNEEGQAKIDNKKCISCGACMVSCPFGAIQDKSFIINTIEILKNSNDNQFIIVTEKGVVDRLKRDYPNKEFILISNNMLCESMKLTTLEEILYSLENEVNEITLDETVRKRSANCIERMLKVSK